MNNEDKELLDEVESIIRRIGIYEWIDYDRRINRLIMIDLKEEEEVKRLRELAEKIGLCPICIYGGKVIFLRNYGNVYGCGQCHYIEPSEEDMKSTREAIEKSKGFIKLGT